MQPASSSAGPRGTALVPTATSDLSRNSTEGDTEEARNAQGRSGRASESTGGRKVAGSNPVGPDFLNVPVGAEGLIVKPHSSAQPRA